MNTIFKTALKGGCHIDNLGTELQTIKSDSLKQNDINQKLIEQKT